MPLLPGSQIIKNDIKTHIYILYFCLGSLAGIIFIYYICIYYLFIYILFIYVFIPFSYLDIYLHLFIDKYSEVYMTKMFRHVALSWHFAMTPAMTLVMTLAMTLDISPCQYIKDRQHRFAMALCHDACHDVCHDASSRRFVMTLCHDAYVYKVWKV